MELLLPVSFYPETALFRNLGVNLHT